MADFLKPSSEGALRQGEVLCGIKEILPSEYRAEVSEIDVTPIAHPFLIVLSQDCDLDWDYRAHNPDNGDEKGDASSKEEKKMSSILFCVTSEAEEVKGRKAINSKKWNQIKINKEDRYHFMESAPPFSDTVDEGLPELCIDFKRYIALPSMFVYSQIEHGMATRRGCLKSPYLEHLSQRFSSYLSRVALPEDYRSAPNI